MEIRITCRQTVTYDQTLEITEEEWEDLKEVTERDIESSSVSPLGDLLDLTDVCDGQEFSYVEIFEVGGAQRVWEPAG